MNRLIITLSLLLPLAAWGKGYCLLSGYVQDARSNERLIGATVYNPATQTGASTNNFGFFSLRIPEGKSKLEIQYVGYKPLSLTIELEKDSTILINLEPGLELGQVIIAGRGRQGHPELSTLNYTRLNLEQIKKLPFFMGETDVLKAIQYQPGIKGGRENTAALNVRGSNGDENLILLDGAPVYNIYHVFGFFSTFNSSVIKNVTLYKGGIPSRFGERLASVVDVSTREGNMKENHASFSISPISGQLSYEAPIKKDTASFIIAARRSFIDLPLVLMQKLADSDQVFGYKFNDINAKANWIIDTNNRLYLSFYTGRDKQFYQSEDEGFKNRNHFEWGNLTGVLRWNKLWGPRLFSNSSVYASLYHYEQEGKSDWEEGSARFSTQSRLQDYSFKTDFEYNVKPGFSLRFGSQLSLLDFSPEVYRTRSNDFATTLGNANKNNAVLGSAYVENLVHLGPFDINGGVRLAAYSPKGKTYFSIQPRLALSLAAGNNYSFSASYMQTSQYLHLLSNSTQGLPTDLWVGSTANIEPECGQQVSLGIEKRINESYRAGLECYYKEMKKLIRFKDGESFSSSLENSWESSVITGKGRAYGTELFLEKQSGRLTGLFSYTLSKSERRFNELNQGNWFPFRFDRRHDLSLNGSYALGAPVGKKRSLSFGFTLQSGNYLSVPDNNEPGLLLPGMENYWFKGMPWFENRVTYDSPNNYKAPAFHHLDLGYSSTKQLKGNRSRTWSFSVYNVYNRLNPWYYHKKEGKLRSVSIFPVIPSVSLIYNW
ncbi:TonB-dependent receptor [Gaoshiqia sp. Z1-71]|uniref:TonB-dependent receptor n=1 Tax=Gaoshiqia hydrogeniformans TaxID=3290090 RepID=UPI003BF8EB5A